MDSMRNLSTSLPNSGRRRLDQPELLMDFKAAALSVTNLYKSAVSIQGKARAIGYQDALDDLLGFLDKENLGLMDWEGWRVRQWATERLDNGGQRQPSSDDEGEAAKEEEAIPVGTRSSSPEVQRKAAVPREPSEEAPSHRRIVSEPPLPEQQHQQSPGTPILPSADTFTFRSTHPYPTNHDRETSMELDKDASPSSTTTASTPPSSTGTDTTVRVYSRPSRSHRHTNHNRQRERGGDNSRGGTISLNLGAGSGSKRKIPYPDFFDISGMNLDGHDRRDGSGGGRGAGGGGKRGRHV
ncbi:hypothetical protein B0A55_02602 [Friedmanniomyces simplex]|uniref:Uncharacterized protein n=1 Tax=Friedmanniomyces simplex TaxID=329884 RepID=A0A4U0XKC0_9PEZI|nr:hypothetical protein B0A55_02602 [Friedmanniomyces simplex]